ncbi:MAG: thioesterase family protein [Neisseria sp.]|jgi:acyl-coA thioester hydrolase, ybgC/ybaW family|uniref:Acyl-CoA thioesterase n=3 Tax=Neisseria TaxID=482 RepID=A0ABY3Y9G4_9NEIS|nr:MULTISPECIES: thioesterase family protein [Neisseria]MDU1533542.1 thioesterase family protein [Neisseria sp.]EET42639.1 acyl-CoA thioester hydrolase, YbgC/YbaW family [Neisseria sicca ATCC 29256]EIG28913.1 putative acyl-CoA thioester hydrolase YbaW [Neisseria sicca VK64]MBF1292080.1 acyl-CoA thioesterase [Neisseria sicca]OFM05379.1 thioesterase [Neisseria sp. HMSC074B07]
MNIRVRNYHLDGYGHVNNARYLEFLEEARWAFFEEHGLLSEIDGLMLVVVRTDIRYRRAAVDGDILRFEGRLKELTSRHIILTQNIVLPSGKNAVEAESTLMVVSAESGRSISIPEPLFTLLKQYAEA